MKKFIILNLTPDSFSGSLSSKDILNNTNNYYCVDIGPQSTRPQAIITSYQEEIERLGNAVQEISQIVKTSIDSFYFETQKFAIQQGVSYINDVTGFADARILQYAPSYVKFIFMHNLGIPPLKEKTMQSNDDVMIDEIKKWGMEKLREFQYLGISKNRFIFDIGIGFGKTAEQSLYLINNIEKFNDFPTPIMVGHSRKSFMNLVNPIATIEEKDEITKKMMIEMSQKGIEYFRVHNIF